jgi:hypothetical protein
MGCVTFQSKILTTRYVESWLALNHLLLKLTAADKYHPHKEKK